MTLEKAKEAQRNRAIWTRRTRLLSGLSTGPLELGLRELFVVPVLARSNTIQLIHFDFLVCIQLNSFMLQQKFAFGGRK